MMKQPRFRGARRAGCFPLAFILYPLSFAFAPAGMLDITGAGAVTGGGAMAAGAAFSPAQVSGAALYLSYLDLPAQARPWGWTNEIAPNQIFTNQGSAMPTNSGLGLYFPGAASNCLVNAASGVSLSNSAASIWICFSITTNARSYDCLLGAANTGGYGLYLNHFLTNPASLIDGSSAVVANNLSAGAQYDVCVARGSPAAVYVNGASTGNYAGAAPSQYTLWGIGQDADSDQWFNGCLKFVLICSNYTFTATDIANLHTYAAAH